MSFIIRRGILNYKEDEEEVAYPHDARIEVWMGELDTLPENYLVCDGSVVETALYTELYKAIGRTYTEKSLSRRNFRLPDFRGRTILGVTSDDQVGKIQVDKLMRHEHKINTASPYVFNGLGGIHPCSSTHTVHKATVRYEGSAEETRMKNVSVYFVLRTEPDDTKNIIGEIAFNPSKVLTSKALFCDGSEVSRTEYSELFAVVGTAYGDGDGSTTFNLPNINQLYIRGTALGSAVDPDRSIRAARPDGIGGDNVGTTQGSGVRSHTHMVQRYTWGGFTGIRKYGPATTTTIQAMGFLDFRPKNTNSTTTGGEIDETADWRERTSFADKNHMKSIKLRAVIFYDN